MVQWRYVCMQGKAWSLAVAQIASKSETQKLQHSWVNQVSSLQKQLKSTRQRLADTIDASDTLADEMAARYTSWYMSQAVEMAGGGGGI
jgi:hypothetical protein